MRLDQGPKVMTSMSAHENYTVSVTYPNRRHSDVRGY